MNLLAISLLLLGLPRPVPVSREAFAMGTVLQVTVHGQTRHAGIQATEGVLAAVDSMDRLLSTWHPSALDSLNRLPVGHAEPVAATLAPLLGEVLAWSDSVQHAFEPVSGSLTDAWQLRGSGRQPSGSMLRRALAATGARGMRFDASAGKVTRLDSLAWLDSGGFGKGAALRAARAVLQQAGIRTAMLDFGGQLLLMGAPAGSARWPVAIADPRDRSRAALRLHVRDASVATSAQSERHVTVRGHLIGHLLDSFSGQPVMPWGSATVIAPDPLIADILSTALFVMGPEAALQWADGHPSIGVVLLVITPAGLDMRASPGARSFLDLPSDQSSGRPSPNKEP